MFFLSHLIYSFSVIYGNTQSLFYELFYELILNPKLELYIILPQYLFFCLLDGIVIDLHLLGIMLLQPFVLIHLAVDELHGHTLLNLHRLLTLLLAIKPCLCPPPHTCPVGIDAHHPRYVKTLDIHVQIGKRVDDAVAARRLMRQALLSEFFFNTSSMVERYT